MLPDCYVGQIAVNLSEPTEVDSVLAVISRHYSVTLNVTTIVVLAVAWLLRPL